MKLFNSVAHFIAATVKLIVKDTPKVVQAAAEAKPVVEAVSAGVAISAGVPPVAVVGFEDLGFALIGEIGNIFVNGTAAQQQHLESAGLDLKVVDSIKAAILAEKALVAAAKAFSGK